VPQREDFVGPALPMKADAATRVAHGEGDPGPVFPRIRRRFDFGIRQVQLRQSPERIPDERALGGTLGPDRQVLELATSAPITQVVWTAGRYPLG
jgi:hypothetical protein